MLLVAPSGSRNISFGLGMDNVTINSLAISSLTANRDAIDSNVTVSRSIGNLLIGGDVQNTNINVGELQSLFTFANFPATSVFASRPRCLLRRPCRRRWPIRKPIPLTDNLEPIAQNGGTLNARIAGNITNSLFTASVDGDPSHGSSRPYLAVLPVTWCCREASSTPRSKGPSTTRVTPS